MFRSFKLKIALISAALSALLLAGFSLYLLEMTYLVGLERTDSELQALMGKYIGRMWGDSQMERLARRLETANQEAEEKDLALIMLDADGTVVYTSDNWPAEYAAKGILEECRSTLTPVAHPEPEMIQTNRPPFFRRGPARPAAISNPVYETYGKHRMMALCNDQASVVVGISLEPLKKEVGVFRRNLLMASPLALLLIISSGWLLAGLALRPVNAITRTARKVTARSLDERVSFAGADHEFMELIDTINQMLDRLERSFRQASRFSADAAHELKTPLAILQTRLDSALQRVADDSDEQCVFAETLDEVQRIDSIIRNLLLLSLADSGRLPLHLEVLDFSYLVQEAANDIMLLDPDQRIEASIKTGIRIEGDSGLIELVLRNLISNAVKYSLGEPPIRLSLETEQNRVDLVVSNRGIPIPETERARIFERFYRVDKARSRAIEGSGLGLSLAREITVAHRGSLELIDGREDETTFRLSLPMPISAP